MKKTVLIALLLAALISGCQFTSVNKYYDSEGFPKFEHYVAGGTRIQYGTGQIGGNIILADRVSKTIIQTEALDDGDSFEFEFDPQDNDMKQELKNMGIDPANIKLSLYFIPHEKPVVVIPK